jgi:hypothetical protein
LRVPLIPTLLAHISNLVFLLPASLAQLSPGIALFPKLGNYRKSPGPSASCQNRKVQSPLATFPSDPKLPSLFLSHRRESQGIGELVGLLDAKMSFAQKGWLARGRIHMAQKTTVTSSSRESALLSGAVALVTGGSRGIGRAIAFCLAQLGSSVAICGRDAGALAATEGELKNSG